MTKQGEHERCADCDAAARHAYSEMTTPGFFYDKCEKHRKPEPINQEMREALRELISKIAAIEAHDSYQSVFQMAALHGFKYTGPNWGKEYAAAKAVLAKADSMGGK